MSRAACLAAAVAALFPIWQLYAIDPDRDFSGRWILDTRVSDLSSVSVPPDQSLGITQQDHAIVCSALSAAGAAQWTYTLDGSEHSNRSGAETRNSATKWEGSALLINTIVSGPRNYVIMDRWKLSRDHAVLTIDREVMRGTSPSEGRFVYRREGQTVTAAPAPRPGALPTRTEPAAASEFTIPAGTHILLTMINAVDTKHSREGDRIYLETAVPVARDGRVVIPRGAAVAGTVTQSKKPGRVAGRAELFVRFDSLTLPNGVTRDFRSRLGSADTSAGRVDRQEGKVTSEGNKAGDARTVAEGAGIGSSVGGVAGGAAGHAAKGVGIGAAAGAAAGLASVLLKRGPDAVLPKGTRVEMVLDRELRFSATELLR